MKFGWAIPQDEVRAEKSLSFAKRCEELGFDSVWVYDHLMPYWLEGRPSLEGWTLLAAVAAQTSRIRIGTLVTNIALRNIGLLAKMAATVDRISNGRLTLGLGTGDELSRFELQSFGYRYRPWPNRLKLIEASVELLRSIWSGRETHVDKPDVRFHGISRPKPVGKIPIWIGGKHPRLGMIAAEHADGWNLWGITLGEIKARIDSMRPRITGRRGFEISWSGRLSRNGIPNRRVEETVDLTGHPDQIDEQVKFLREIGTGHIIFYPKRGKESDLLEWFAKRAFD